MMFILLTLFLILLVTYLAKQMRKPPNFPPGPLWLPFMGNLLELKNLSKSLGSQHLALEAMAKKYKTNVLGLKLGKELVVSVFSYPLVREVLTSEEYEARPDNFFLRLRCMGTKRGITCTEGEIWHNQRNFVNRHLRNLGFGKQPMEKMIRDEVTEILSVLDSSGTNISVDKLLAPSVINVLWTLVTGERIPREDTQLNEILDLFNLRSRAFDMTGGTLSQYPWLRYVLPEWSGFNLIQKVNASLGDLFMKTIREHQGKWEDGKNDDLIYRYISEMRAADQESKDFTESQLVMVCLDLFIAGSQTTSGTLSFAFLLMIMYPDIQIRVQAEIDKHFEKNSVIEYANRHRIPYVEAVLLETMRFRNVTPIIGPRRVKKNATLDGYFLPKDTTILISLDSVHNNSTYWKNPEIFFPERFLDENGLLLKNEKLIPFGLGRRRCLGEALAKNCIFLFFVEILRNYSVSLSFESNPLTGKYLAGIILSPERYKATFTKRLS